MEELFEKKEEIGSGFSSDVFRAVKLSEPYLGQSFAMKQINLEYSPQATNEISVSFDIF
jgi:hypothetical protein